MSLGNRVVAAILRSPLHPVLSRGVALVRYEAPRSGRTVQTPVQYAELDDGLVLLVARPETKTWWRAFRSPHRLDVLVRGRWRPLCGRVVRSAVEPDVAAPLAEAYRRRFPSAERVMGGDLTFVWCEAGQA
jgi:hypothetical protein